MTASTLADEELFSDSDAGDPTYGEFDESGDEIAPGAADEPMDETSLEIMTKLGNGRRDQISDLSEDTLYRLLSYMASDVYLTRDLIRGDFAAFAWGTLKLERSDDTVTCEAILKAFQLEIWKIQYIMYIFIDKGLISAVREDFPEVGNPMSMFSKFSEVVCNCRDAVFSEWRTRSIADSNTDVHIPAAMGLQRFSFREWTGLTEFQNMLIFMLERLRRVGYRKRGSECYAEITVHSHGHRYGTRAWKRACTIEQFIYKNVNMDTQFEQWKNLTSGGKIVDRAVEYLTQCVDTSFPPVQPSRYLFAFQNGLYHTWSNTFHPWGPCIDTLEVRCADALKQKREDLMSEIRDEEDGLAEEECRKEMNYYEDNMKRLLADIKTMDACNFINQPFDPAWQGGCPSPIPEDPELDPEDPELDPELDWENIETPAFDTILGHQKLGHAEGRSDQENRRAQRETHRWIYVLAGRMLYDLGDRDQWQVIPYFRGLAGTGKSTIGTAVKNFYNPEDVAHLSNNIEAKFGLQNIYDKRLWVCFEAKENFGLQQTEFQSMVSGEPMSIPVKGKNAVFTVWKAPGMMCGNELPGWVNAQGSISRRVVLTDFTEGIRGGDPMLPAKLASQTAALLVKCNRAYCWATKRYGHELIWKNLPAYFHDKQAQLEMETDSFYYFIMFSEDLEREYDHGAQEIGEDERDGFFMARETLEKLYATWCKGAHRKMINLSDKNNVRHTLTRAKLQMRNDERTIGGVGVRGSWILGVRQRSTTAAGLEQTQRNTHALMLSHTVAHAGMPPV